MFSQLLTSALAQWAGPITGIAAALFVLFTGYVVTGDRRKSRAQPPSKPSVADARKQWRAPHLNRLLTDLEDRVELTWK